MGQRLLLTIRDKDSNAVASAYYHWSAYTESSYDITSNVVSALTTYWCDEAGLPAEVAAYRALTSTGAGIDVPKSFGVEPSETFIYLKSKYPRIGIAPSSSRNEGIIILGPEIEHWKDSGEYYVDVYLPDLNEVSNPCADEFKIDFDVVCNYEDLDFVKEIFPGLAKDDVCESNINLGSCTLSELETFMTNELGRYTIVNTSDGYVSEIA